MRHRFPLALGLLLALTGAPSIAQVAAVPANVAQVSLLKGWRQAEGTHLAAVAIRLAPGWHTYWRVPGAAGIPPQFDWAGSRNLASVRFEWPRPIVFETAGIPTIGYADELVLPMILTPIDKEAPIEVAVEMFFGVCEQICVPADARLSARLEADAAPEGRARIAAALADRPQTAEEAGVARMTCGLAPGARGYELTAEVTFTGARGPARMAVIEAADPELWIGTADSRAQGRSVTATAPVESAGPDGPVLDRSALRVTLIDENRAVEIRGCQAPG